MKLNEQRKKIDSIDEQIATLFNERFKVVSEIKEIKKQASMDITQQDREEEIISKNQTFVDLEYRAYFIDFYKHLISLSKAYQAK